MAPKSSTRTGAQLVGSGRILTDEARRRAEVRRLQVGHLLADAERDFAGGERSALVLAIRCWLMLSGAPAWMTSAWSKACNDVGSAVVDSWDEPLGNERPKSGSAWSAKRTERLLLARMREAMNDPALAKLPKTDKPNGLYGALADRLGVKASRIRKLETRLPAKYKRADLRRNTPKSLK